MHKSSMLRMEWFANNFGTDIRKNKIKVLDIGSYDVNGSYKQFFSDPNHDYTGLDIEPGPNVDIVLSNPYDWSSIETDSYDIIISGQTFEHAEFFWDVLKEMVRALKKGGLLCIIAPNGFVEHRYPVDCYRFFSDGMVALARYTNLEILHSHTNAAPIGCLEWYSLDCADSMLVAKKPYGGDAKMLDLKTYECVPAVQPSLRDGMIPYEQLGFLSKGVVWFNHVVKHTKQLPSTIKNIIIK